MDDEKLTIVRKYIGRELLEFTHIKEVLGYDLIRQMLNAIGRFEDDKIYKFILEVEQTDEVKN